MKETSWGRENTEPRTLKMMSLQLGVSESKLRKDIHSGKLRAIMDHGQWKILPDDIERYRVGVLSKEPIDYSLWLPLAVEEAKLKGW